MNSWALFDIGSCYHGNHQYLGLIIGDDDSRVRSRDKATAEKINRGGGQRGAWVKCGGGGGEGQSLLDFQNLFAI